MSNQGYICGKYSGTPEQIHGHILAAVEAAPRVLAAGFAPIIPHTMFDHRRTDWETAMIRCRDLIRGLDPARDILVALPNWTESRGAREEVGLALELRIPVVHLADL